MHRIEPLLDQCLGRRKYTLVKPRPATDRQKAFLLNLIEGRCPLMTEDLRRRLLEAYEEIASSGYWTSIFIDELRLHAPLNRRCNAKDGVRCVECSNPVSGPRLYEESRQGA